MTQSNSIDLSQTLCSLEQLGRQLYDAQPTEVAEAQSIMHGIGFSIMQLADSVQQRAFDLESSEPAVERIGGDTPRDYLTELEQRIFGARGICLTLAVAEGVEGPEHLAADGAAQLLSLAHQSLEGLVREKTPATLGPGLLRAAQIVTEQLGETRDADAVAALSRVRDRLYELAG